MPRLGEHTEQPCIAEVPSPGPLEETANAALPCPCETSLLYHKTRYVEHAVADGSAEPHSHFLIHGAEEDLPQRRVAANGG
eukprot:9076674-Pyramimonas_sp.AAC.1